MDAISFLFVTLAMFIIGKVSASLADFLAVAMKEDQILEKYGQWLKFRFGIYEDGKFTGNYNKIAKPLGLCPMCTAWWIAKIMVAGFYSMVFYPGFGLGVFFFMICAGFCMREFIE